MWLDQHESIDAVLFALEILGILLGVSAVGGFFTWYRRASTFSDNIFGSDPFSSVPNKHKDSKDTDYHRSNSVSLRTETQEPDSTTNSALHSARVGAFQEFQNSVLSTTGSEKTDDALNSRIK